MVLGFAFLFVFDVLFDHFSYMFIYFQSRGVLGGHWWVLWTSLAVLGGPWGFLVGLWDVLGDAWAVLGGSLGVLELFLGSLGGLPVHPWGILGGPWGVLGGSWGVLGDSLGDPVGDQVRQTLRTARFQRFMFFGDLFQNACVVISISVF